MLTIVYVNFYMTIYVNKKKFPLESNFIPIYRNFGPKHIQLDIRHPMCRKSFIKSMCEEGQYHIKPTPPIPGQENLGTCLCHAPTIHLKQNERTQTNIQLPKILIFSNFYLCYNFRASTVTDEQLSVTLNNAYSSLCLHKFCTFIYKIQVKTNYIIDSH